MILYFTDKEIEIQRGEVTTSRPHHQLGKASVLSDSFHWVRPEEVQFRFEESLSVPILLIKWCRQYVRAAATQGNTTLRVCPTARSQPHSHHSPLAPWFPNVTCSVPDILKIRSKETALNQLLSVAVSLTVEFPWQKHINQQASPSSSLFFLPHKT